MGSFPSDVLPKRAQSTADAMIAGLEVVQDVESGVAYKKLLDRAFNEHTDVIVVSTHGRTGLLEALIGDVAELVIRLSSCPVLSIRPAMRKAENKAA